MIVTAHSAIDYEQLVERRRSSSTSATRPAGTAASTEGLEAVTRRRVGRARLLGPEPRAQLRRARRAALALRRLAGRARARSRRAIRRRARPTSFDELLADPELDAVVVATPVPTHYELAQARARGRQARAGREAAGDERRPRWRSSSRLAERARPRADAGPPAALPPGGAQAEGARSTPASSATCSASTRNRQNLGTIRTDENALWSLGVHDLSVILYLLDEEPSEAWAHGNAFLTPGVEDVVFCYLRFPSGKIAHMHLSWLDPHKMRRMTVVGKREDGRLRRHGARAQGDGLREGAVAADRDLRRVADAHRRHLQSRRSRTTSRCGSSAGSSSSSSPARATGCRPRGTALAVVRVLEQLQASLVAAPA